MKPGSTGVLKDFFLMKGKKQHMNCISNNLEPEFISSFSRSQKSTVFQ